jgi:hypothetical protein
MEASCAFKPLMVSSFATIAFCNSSIMSSSSALQYCTSPAVKKKEKEKVPPLLLTQIIGITVRCYSLFYSDF